MENIIQNNEVDIYEKFEDMDLSDELLRGIFAYGYEKPSVIQQKAIKQLITDGENFYGNIFKGKYLDCGTLSGYIKSNIEISKEIKK